MTIGLSASQQSIVWYLIWNERNSNANKAAHLSIWPKVNAWSSNGHWFCWPFYQYLMDDPCWHASYQYSGWMCMCADAFDLGWITYSSEKVKQLYWLLVQPKAKLPFSKFMQRPQIKFHADTLSYTKGIKVFLRLLT